MCRTRWEICVLRPRFGSPGYGANAWNRFRLASLIGRPRQQQPFPPKQPLLRVPDIGQGHFATLVAALTCQR